MTQTRASHHKYRRSRKRQPLALTLDDLTILREIYRHDIIDTKGVASLLAPRSYDKVSRRLRRLWQAEYLERLSQLEHIFVPGGGSRPIAYTLGTKGMSAVEDQFALPAQRTRLRERAKRIKPSTVRHALEQSQFIVGLRQSVERTPDLLFLYPEDIYRRFAPEILERPRLPYTLSTQLRWFSYRGVQGTNPDGLFMLYNPSAPEGRQRRTIFLEIDRGTETINPSDSQTKSQKFWERTSILRKYVVYAYAFRTGEHVEQFGVPTFQVLTVTTTPERVQEMQIMYQERLATEPHDAHPIRFLFTDWQTIKQHGSDYLSLPVTNGIGERATLMV